MQEIVGYIFCGIAFLCAIGVFRISAQTRSYSDMHDLRSVFERDYKHHSKLAKNPKFVILVSVGLFCAFIGIALVFSG